MGKVAVLLPSTALAKGARVPIGSAFEVTPGSLAVFACFSDHPLPVDILQSQIFNRGVQAKTAPREAEPPDGCAKASLEVVP